MSQVYVPLRIHSQFSLVDSVVRIPQLISAAKDRGFAALALTDEANLFAAVKFYRAAQNAGMKAILGADVWLMPEEAGDAPARLSMLVTGRDGYLNLSRLLTRGYLEGQELGHPMLDRSWLSKDSCKGLIALSGAHKGDIGRALLAGKVDVAARELEHMRSLFGDGFYLEGQRMGRQEDETHLAAAVELAVKETCPIVATNPVRFVDAQDFDAHEARVCIRQGRTLDDPRRPKDYTHDQYLRSADEMQSLFADLPALLDNTVEIAKRCNLTMTLGKSVLPDFPVPEGENVETFLIGESEKGLVDRLQAHPPPEGIDPQEYNDRLKLELDVIIQMGFPGYFLIVADFIRWAKAQKIPVGPGRGSGAGSLVAYALQITDLDPIRYELLFERFLNPERVSMPDFDVDFCMDRRDEVIDYVADHYGRNRVSQIITYGSMAAKAVVRDVGRVLGYPYGLVDKIAKLVPGTPGVKLKEAMDESEEMRELYERDEEVQSILDLALKLEGLARNAGKHAGGVVISPSALTDFSPLYCEQGGDSIVTQFDKDDVEAAGLVKFDFLGLRTLTILDWALDNHEQQSGDARIDIAALPLDDVASFKLLKACQTTAVFQLESRGMKELIKRLQPDSFEDIVALVALYRPGPLQSGMVDDFIERKHGRQKVVYPHPDLEPILKPTYGVILYQEQVMQIAQVLANYTLGGADLLRRAMGKKKPEEMAKQREIFHKGSIERGVDGDLANAIFDLMEKFAGYGFNKSHSAAYALVSYQTAWMKAHHGAAFMAAVMSADMDNTDKVVMLIDECRHMDLEVAAPDVNRSRFRFTVADEKTIIYGLGAIKGVGRAALDSIIEECANNGPYKDLLDFAQRIDSKRVSKRVMEALIKAGALDKLLPNRATGLHNIEGVLQAADQQTKAALAGQSDMFGLFAEDETDEGSFTVNEQPEMDDTVRLRGEKETLGLYLTGHPLSRYEAELAQLTSESIIKLNDAIGPEEEKQASIAGLVVSQRTIKTQRGDLLLILSLDDRTARIDVTFFAERALKARELLGGEAVLLVSGTASHDDFTDGARMRADRVTSLEHARLDYVRSVHLKIKDASQLPTGWVDRLYEAISPFRGGKSAMVLHYRTDGAEGQVEFDEQWKVTVNDALIKAVNETLGPDTVKIEYYPAAVRARIEERQSQAVA